MSVFFNANMTTLRIGEKVAKQGYEWWYVYINFFRGKFYARVLRPGNFYICFLTVWYFKYVFKRGLEKRKFG